jgi:hypothetical protein
VVSSDGAQVVPFSVCHEFDGFTFCQDGPSVFNIITTPSGNRSVIQEARNRYTITGGGCETSGVDTSHSHIIDGFDERREMSFNRRNFSSLDVATLTSDA